MQRMSAVVGREPELRAVERLLGEGSSGFAALVLEGEAGIGKTTVWREAVRRADDAGTRVLACRPAQAEATLGYAALADLFRPLDDELLSGLPEPQRRAIEVALLRERGRAGADSRAAATAVLSILTSLTREPALLAIDDAQWLDASSATALSFALRRVPPEARLAVLVAVRVEDGSATSPLDLDDLPMPAERVRLSPLSLSATYHVVRAHLGLTLARPLLLRIEQESRGNPLFALELARALEESGGRLAPGEPLPVPESLSGLLRRRVSRMPEPTRDALLAAALLSTPTATVIQRALGAGARSALDTALREGVIEIRADAIRFGHPLLASAVSSSVLADDLRRMHRLLADVVEIEEQRAMHLALGTEPPAEEVAATLERAASQANERGASHEEAELLDLACRFTPAHDRDALARRTLELAKATWRAGAGREAIRLLDAFLESDVRGAIRAQALELRAQTHWVAGTTEAAEACCAEALSHVGDDDRVRARVLVTLARVTLDAKHVRERSLVALAALEALEDPDPALLSEALVALAGAEYYLGHGLRWDVIDRALELERATPPRNVSDRMSAALGTWLKYDGDFDGARRWLEATRLAAIEEGDEGSLPYALGHLPQLELWTGNWVAAEALALEHLDLAERTGQALERLTAIFNLALVEAHVGREDEARARLEPTLEEAKGGDPWNTYQLLSALGFLELSAGRLDEAVAALREAFEIYEGTGAGDTPSVFENYAEALVGTGELVRAREVIDLYEQRARTARKALTLAPAMRCRGLVAEGTGDLATAVAALDEALTQHEQVAMPFSRARTLLVLGRVRRRIGERRKAVQALEEALSIFESLGAPRWEGRARTELGRVPSRRSVATAALTPTEELVATLVAEGRTNKEVAQALFISEKTVEANLTRIYRKLGVSSRVALASQLAGARGSEPAIP
jgi:DNA-binding CsgD family transcriptional regulator